MLESRTLPHHKPILTPLGLRRDDTEYEARDLDYPAGSILADGVELARLGRFPAAWR